LLLTHYYPVRYEPHDIPGGQKGAGPSCAKKDLSANQALKNVDGRQDELMNRILWFAAKGEERYPGPAGVSRKQGTAVRTRVLGLKKYG
jgi:hypothetical protein